ncbi:MAG: phospholipid carrier-dependent glycosyltransferase [Kineosporiaceae bacterium]|nr:phospholipid carrier-dependent glycosyltransferase [Kineosporiaceae bacterium]
MSTSQPSTAGPHRLWAWLGPGLVAVFGAFVRFWHLDRPPWIAFDETYYVKEGLSMTRYGVEVFLKPSLGKDNSAQMLAANKLLESGSTDFFDPTRPDFVVHPPLGKWLIGLGMWLFGDGTSPFGWRFTVALLGSLSILMLGRIATRLLGSALLGSTAALLLALDGMHFTLSRIAVLDMMVMFWALAAFGCLLIDRDRARARLLARAPTRFGPGQGLRGWRIVAGICLGCCAATKWSGLYVAAIFGLLTVLWDVAARRAAGGRLWLAVALVRDGTVAAVQILPIMALTYLATWTGWIRSSLGYGRNWAEQNPATGAAAMLPDWARSLIHYHVDMYNSAISITSPHAYSSNPWSWIVQGRPTSIAYLEWTAGNHPCPYDKCVRAVTALGNPVIWWGGTIAVAVLLVAWALGRDWRAGAILAGLVATYLPWFAYQGRTIFTFYSVAFAPYVVLALTYALGLLLGPPRAGLLRRRWGAAAAGGLVLAALVAFAFFYPVWSAQRISHAAWVARMWLPSWI